MEAKDLRIGNYIFSNETQKNEKIVGITEEHPFLNTITFDYVSYEDIEPISLTEDWLLKFGFNDEEYIDGYIGVTNNGISFALNKPNETKEYYTFEISHGRVPIIIKFNYVHELQNLYHSLTGVELIVKEQ